MAVDADWSDARHVNRYVSGTSREGDGDARISLDEFQPFPAWVWRNTAMFDFVDWLKKHNSSRSSAQGTVGFYGLDFFRSHAAMAAVISSVRSSGVARDFMAQERLQRALGIVYEPDDPRFARPYFQARLADQFDAVIHFDQTTATQPLDDQPGVEAVDVPESVSAAL